MVYGTVRFVALTDVETQQVLSGVVQVVQGEAMQERSHWKIMKKTLQSIKYKIRIIINFYTITEDQYTIIIKTV